LFGNRIFRQIQIDGTEALPVKMGGKHHFGGEIKVGTDGLVRKLVDVVEPLLKVREECLRVVIPPQPRYLDKGCCEERGHSTNVKVEGHKGRILEELRRVRAVLKVELLRRGVRKFQLLDSCMVGEKAEGTSLKERVECMEGAFGMDGIHFRREGYERMARVVLEEARMAEDRIESKEERQKEKKFFWRGIESPVGRGRGREEGKREERGMGRDQGMRVELPVFGRGGRSMGGRLGGHP
jgi:hypothetical protein